MPPTSQPFFSVYLDNYRMASQTFRLGVHSRLIDCNQRFCADLVIGWGVN